MKPDASIRFSVNRRAHAVTTSADRPLLDVLREDLGLTGTKYGCGEAQCGACSVLIDNERVFSCRTPISRVEGKDVTTIEGLGVGQELHAVQRAFLTAGAFQCGYCTAGMIVTAVGLLAQNPGITETELAAGMDRNICRCSSHPKILEAILSAARDARR